MSEDWKPILKHLLLVMITVASILPFAWMISASFKPIEEITSTQLVPESPQPENYSAVLRLTPDPNTGRFLKLNFPRWYFNSLLITGWITTLTVLTSSMAAYAFSRIDWPGRDSVFLLYIATMMVPGLILLLPGYQIMVKMDWVNTYKGLILTQSFSAFGTFLMRQYMLGIPRSYDEAAMIDGASHLRVFGDIILNLSRPGLFALTIFIFLGQYRSFFWPLIMIRDDHLRTLPIGLLSFQESHFSQTELLMAATTMATLPLIVVFAFMQKQIVKGVQIGGIKG